ncbi:MAG: sugar transferase [Solirubrobacterales bacterium]
MRDIRYRRPYFLSSLLRPENYRRLARLLSLVVLDVAGVVAALYAALAVKALVLDRFAAADVWATTREYTPFVFLVLVLLFARSGLYSHREARPGLSRIFAGLFQVALVSLIFAELNGLDFQSYYVFYGTLTFAAVFIGGGRFVHGRMTLRMLRALGHKRRAVLVGSGDHIEAVAHALEAAPVQKYDAIGFISLEPRESNGLKSLGTLRDLPTQLDEHQIDEVIVADPDFPEEEAVELVDQCHQRGVAVRIAPSTMELLVHRAEFIPGEPIPLFELRPPVFEGIDFALKRAFDFFGASLLLLIASPVFLIAAALIRISSRGPIFYRSIRPGIWGQPFGCLKFRTMHIDADQRQAELEESNEASGALFKIRDDPRLTTVGRALRKFSLDELPQLINVLKGEMSLVGPRPLPERDYERLDPWHRKRYLVLPGITGLWQVSGRADLDFDDLVRLDFLYLERWSVFLDITILLKTVPAVLLRRGAY